MLVRSASRRQRRCTCHLLAASFAQLNLPWLAPAQLRWTASQASTGAQTPTQTPRRSLSRSRTAQAQTRRLATATDQYTRNFDAPPLGWSNGYRNSAQDRNVPWATSKASQEAKHKFPSLRSDHDPIILNTSTHTAAQLIKVQIGVHGTVAELLQHLHTSLCVGRRGRAEAIIQRLAEQSSPSSPEMLYAHTAYLENALETLSANGTPTAQVRETLKDMQRWFEVEVQGKGVQPNGKLLVVMIRAAIRAMNGSSRDRSIRRYATLAKSIDPDTYDDVLCSEDYNDNEFTIIGRVASDYYLGQEEAVEKQEDIQSAPEISPESAQHRGVLPLEDLPEVLSTEQKGEGLIGIKRVMHPMVSLPSLPADASAEAHRARAYERQQLMEEMSVEVAVDRWRKADEDLRKIGIHTAMQSKPVGALMWQWYQALLPALEKELAETKATLNTTVKHDHDRHAYGPYLELLPLHKVAANTILYTMSKFMNGKSRDSGKYEQDVKLNNLTTGLGKTIEQECSAETSAQNAKKKTGQVEAGGAKRAKYMNGRNKRDRRRVNHSNQSALAEMEWPLAVKVKLGAMLMSKLIEAAHLPVTRHHPRSKEKITQMQPAFLHRVQYSLGKKVGMLSPNPALMEKLESEPIGTLIAKRMPMVVEPKPWTGFSSGGYLHYSNSIMRLPPGDKSGIDYFRAADTKGDVQQIYDGLNALGKVPWKVNHDVFKVQLEAWNTGEEVANFAPLHPQLPIPPEPEASADPVPRRKWLLELRELENKRSGLHSKRCFQNFQLEVSRAMVNETLYFPHNMDFRGRAYPIPPYLNHMGADNVRGLLTFAEGKELGREGLRWLQIHLATVAGYDKASLEERVEFTKQHLEDIYDSVRNPLGGRRWWLKAEDAWQTLAACFELTKALDSPDPTKFVSHLPIQQDGTCNGLQHYAALGGDEIGARQVNLEPGDRPADVYTAVAEAVKEEVRLDAEKGHAIARKLHGRITRKCVKQPVMTNVYGVTFYGAKAQVRKQLEVLFPEVGRYDAVNLGNMSHYIAAKIFKSLGTMFGGAQAIQHWLGQAADRISTCITPEQVKKLSSARPDVSTEKSRGRGKKPTVLAATDPSVANGNREGQREIQQLCKKLFRSTVVWTTPLRLPVVQPYRSTKSRLIKTSMQLFALQEPQVWDPVSKRKQLQAFPPNFIHSLDATHMLLSANKCREIGLTFASVHDSFWTHARDIGALSSVLRDAFVEMHSDDIVGRLREEFETRYHGGLYMASVFARSPIGLQVRQWRKAMNGAMFGEGGELALEAERLRLLASADAAERARGAAMVTPGSLVAGEGADSAALAPPAEMRGQKLGDMPEPAADVDLDLDADPDLDVDLADPGPGGDVAASLGLAAGEGIVSGSVMAQDPAGPPAAAAAPSAPAAAAAGPAQPSPKYPAKLGVWLPIQFPPVPAKGRFDVTRLRASKYFFH